MELIRRQNELLNKKWQAGAEYDEELVKVKAEKGLAANKTQQTGEGAADAQSGIKQRTVEMAQALADAGVKGVKRLAYEELRQRAAATVQETATAQQAIKGSTVIRSDEEAVKPPCDYCSANSLVCAPAEGKRASSCAECVKRRSRCSWNESNPDGGRKRKALSDPAPSLSKRMRSESDPQSNAGTADALGELTFSIGLLAGSMTDLSNKMGPVVSELRGLWADGRTRSELDDKRLDCIGALLTGVLRKLDPSALADSKPLCLLWDDGPPMHAQISTAWTEENERANE